MVRSRFRGEIVGVGGDSGVRIVVGRWPSSPLGSFADVMVESADGHRVLLAPSAEVAEFVAATYSFDSVRLEDVRVDVTPGHWSVRSPSLQLDVAFGSRTLLGRLLRLVPARIAESPAWCTLTDPVARVVLRGVRTRGSARGGRREWYGATDHRAVTGLSGSFDATDLGGLEPVLPSPRFGFSSTPARPSLTQVVTTVEW
ncbi:hypothetical protein JK386_17850 [Nocardioides sp. zg-536]|uniref:Uncharacterized protein n=1 Tax=Nocardioides faecalis TaxID=2803858 RepID=A0A938Y9M6_9ACTN|nr:hypothetical protein [Nocardioides faecalis]MBM9461759.1 hypothetical protein [Nocardioides faecalis]QVI58958.1 hypothetical protein KG111_00720 [Nocardioides faecalis]